METNEDKDLSKFDFGPMNTTISGNSVEGARLRVGGFTTANLNKHWFWKGYVAYGFRDHRVKYSSRVEYSFKLYSYDCCFVILYSENAKVSMYYLQIKQIGFIILRKGGLS